MPFLAITLVHILPSCGCCFLLAVGSWLYGVQCCRVHAPLATRPSTALQADSLLQATMWHLSCVAALCFERGSNCQLPPCVCVCMSHGRFAQAV